VLAGIPEGLNALQIDGQIANRFEPVFLPKWRPGEEFDRLLLSMETVLPLKRRSTLAGATISRRIIEESEGLIGEMMRLIRLLAIQAIRDGSEQITADALAPERLRQLRWRRPSERARYAG